MSHQDNGNTESTTTRPPAPWPPAPRAAVFYGYSRNPDSLENTLSIETAEGSSADDPERVVALILVDTNYKPGRLGQHPVQLTRVDAVKAAVALLNKVVEGYPGEPVDPAGAATLLRELQAVDFAVSDLREQLLIDLTPQNPDSALEQDDATT